MLVAGSTSLTVLLFVVVPLVALCVGLVTTGISIRRLGDGRLAFLVVVLGFMAVHQSLELADFLATGTFVGDDNSEIMETAVNLLAVGSINYVVWHLHEERLLRENLAALNRFLRHDLRNDLNLVRGYVEDVDPDDERERDSLDAAVTGIDTFVRKAERTRYLEEFVKHHAASPGSCDLDLTLTPAVERVRNRFPDADVEYDPPADETVVGGDILTYVFEMLVENAVVHNDGDGAANVWVDVAEGERRGTVVVSVADDGPGISRGQRELLLEGDEADPLDHGEGLGLFFVRTVVDVWEGDVRIRDRDPRGTVVSVTLSQPTTLTKLRSRLSG
jgi:signal transduction histidine kinase